MMLRRHPTMREVLSDRLPRSGVGTGPQHAGTRLVVTISRQPGARGREVAFALAGRVGLEVHDRDIIHEIAESTHSREAAVASLEDEDRPLLRDWLASFATDAQLSRFAYVHHLTGIVESIARFGGAVILGRGAHLILGPGRALRVFVVAPLETRVATVMAKYRVDAREASRRISAKEAERRAFLKKYFRADFGDPATFDLFVNTGVLGVEGAVDAIQASLKRTPQLQYA